MATLTDRLDDLLHRVWHVEYPDVVEAVALHNGNGKGYWYIDVLRAKDSAKIRMNRIGTEMNDVVIPAVEDPKSGIESVTLIYRRKIVRVLGFVFEDRPIMEEKINYTDGRGETREVHYDKLEPIIKI